MKKYYKGRKRRLEEYSVLMSVYGKEKSLFLRQAVDSMLAQTVPPREVVLVCDGPLGEDLDRVIDAFQKKEGERFQVVRLPENRGLALALNAGLEHCSCSWIARMDSDDIALSDRMEKQFKLAEKTSATLLSGTIAEFGGAPDEETIQKTIEKILLNKDELSQRQLPGEDEKIRKFSRSRNPMNHPAVLMKKEDVIRAGKYDAKYPYFEDYDLWLRMLKCGVKASNVQDLILLMRADEGLYDRRSGKEYQGYMKAFRKRMLREKDCNRMEYMTSVITRSMVAAAPSGLRRKFYGTVLRK